MVVMVVMVVVVVVVAAARGAPGMAVAVVCRKRGWLGRRVAVAMRVRLLGHVLLLLRWRQRRLSVAVPMSPFVVAVAVVVPHRSDSKESAKRRSLFENSARERAREREEREGHTK
jgi:hypothetical protein